MLVSDVGVRSWASRRWSRRSRSIDSVSELLLGTEGEFVRDRDILAVVRGMERRRLGAVRG